MILNVPAVLPDNTLAPAAVQKKFTHSFAGLGLDDGVDDSVDLFSGSGLDSANGSVFYGPTDQQLLGLTPAGTPVSSTSGQITSGYVPRVPALELFIPRQLKPLRPKAPRLRRARRRRRRDCLPWRRKPCFSPG